MKNLTSSRQERKTLVAGVRYDPRTLATLVKFFHEEEQPVASVGEALRFACETLAEIVVVKSRGFAFATETEAVEYLRSKGLLTSLSARNSRRLHSSLALESFDKTEEEAELLEIVKEKMREGGIPRPFEDLARRPNGIVKEEE